MIQKNKHYHPTKLRSIIQITARLIKDNPRLLDDIDAPDPLAYLRAQLVISIPELADKTHCTNCGASMAEYIFEFSVLDALLLQAMAENIREKIHKGVPFTEANRVHLPSLTTSSHNVNKRMTYTSKLGLIAKYIVNKHQVSGVWVITDKGWAALRGEPVRRSVKVYRGQILDREESYTTISAVYAKYKPRKSDRDDHRKVISEYNKEDWVQIAGYHQGTIL